MRRLGSFLRGLTAASVLVGGTAAHGASPLRILPAVSPWNLHYADESCLLARSFGTGRDLVHLRLEQTAPSNRFSAVLIGQAFRSVHMTTDLTLTFGPGGGPDKRERVMTATSTVGEKLPMLLIEGASLQGASLPSKATAADPALPALEGEAGFSYLTIDRSIGGDLQLDTGEMDKPMAALRACTDDLVRSWGLDPGVQSTLQRRAAPKGNPGNWFRPEDFPNAFTGDSAVVRFRVVIDASGAITECAIPSATKGEEFERATCEVLRKRGRFEPALDASGKSVASYYTNTVSWISGVSG